MTSDKWQRTNLKVFQKNNKTSARKECWIKSLSNIIYNKQISTNFFSCEEIKINELSVLLFWILLFKQSKQRSKVFKRLFQYWHTFAGRKIQKKKEHRNLRHKNSRETFFDKLTKKDFHWWVFFNYFFFYFFFIFAMNNFCENCKKFHKTQNFLQNNMILTLMIHTRHSRHSRRSRHTANNWQEGTTNR